ncbi:MAG: glycoside hydrolase family 97 protein, partial [Prevotella sp.]|nr:glycoside hydrolase family 97 protein [Prevotella sp.]
MKQFLIILTICLGSLSLSAQQPVSPNGKLTITNSGQGIIVNYQQQEVLNIPVLGYEGIKSNRLKFKSIG